MSHLKSAGSGLRLQSPSFFYKFSRVFLETRMLQGQPAKSKIKLNVLVFLRLVITQAVYIKHTSYDISVNHVSFSLFNIV